MTKLIAQFRTLALVFSATMVGLVVAGGPEKILTLDSWADWKPYVSGAVAAVVVYVYNWLSPYDQRYGIGS